MKTVATCKIRHLKLAECCFIESQNKRVNGGGGGVCMYLLVCIY